ncbi:outer membrane beta-barrel family protein [soil metagenome]
MRPSHSCLLLLLSLLFSIPLSIRAQNANKGSIKGVVADEQKTPLPYATVILKKASDSAIYKTALSNEKGVFAFVDIKPGAYLLAISMTGFEKLKITDLHIDTNQINSGVLILKTSTQMLKGVTIKGQTPLIERQIDKTVVNVDNSITNAGSTVLEMMQKLPGVQMSADGQLTLNGKPGINVFIDDKPTYLSAADLAGLLGGMPSSAIQKIEIMTNPSAKYDAAGNGGIINIIKKKNRREGFNGSVTTGFGQSTFSKYNGGLLLSYKNKSYNLYVNNGYSYNKTLFNRTVTNDVFDDNHHLQAEQVSVNNSINSSSSFTPSAGLDLYLSKRSTLSLSGNVAARSGDDNTISAMSLLNGVRVKTNDEAFTSSTNDHPFNYTAGMQLTQQLDTAGRELSIDADYSNYRNKPVQHNATILNDAAGNFIDESNVLLNQRRQLNIYAVKADYLQPLHNKGRLEAGWKSSYVRAVNDNSYFNQSGGQNIIDSAQSSNSVNTENINAAYINLNKTYKKLTLQAGLRAEQTITDGQQLLTGESIRQNYLQLFPTAFFDYQLNDQNGLNIKLGRRTERAAYNEMVLFRRPLTPTLFFQGNPNLRPQLSYHAEITYKYHSTLFLTFGYDVYRDYIRTLPYLDTNRITVTRIPTNIQGAHSWNVDIAWSGKVTTWWSADNTLSIYQNAFNGQVPGFSLNDAGMPSIYLSMNNSFTISSKLTAACDFEYNSNRRLVTSTFGAYSVLSFGLKQQLFNNRASVAVNANNILQSEDHNAIDSYKDLVQTSYYKFNTRSVRLTFSYRFGSGKQARARIESRSAEEQKRAGG